MTQLMDEQLARQFDRLPPHDISAEMCVLASAILGNEINHAEIAGIVGRDMFFQSDHQIIFDVLCDMRRANKPMDLILLRAELIRRQLFEEVGGIGYLSQIVGSLPSYHHGPHYAQIVREKSMLRGLLELGNDMLRRVYAASDHDVSTDIAQALAGKLAKMIEPYSTGQIHRIGDLVRDVYDQLGQGGTETIPFGFYELDAATGGLAIGEMCVIAARPSMGKSTLIKQIAVRDAMAGIPVGIISLEEGRFKIGRNILASEARIENGKIRNAKFLNSQDWSELADGVTRLAESPLYVVDTARRMSDIRAKAAIMAARHGVKLIIIDYLQRIRGVQGRDRYEQVSNTSLDLSDMFKELGVAGIAVAQLNRGVENREDKRPIMSDLRDSGQIEQDADSIIFLHREDYYHLDESDYPQTRIAELIIAKFRDSARGGIVRLQSNLKYQRFNDLSAVEDDNDIPA